MTRFVATKDLDALAAEATAFVSAKAEETRGLFLTSGTGKALEYAEKARECERWMADPAPDIESYPLIRAEMVAHQRAGISLTPQQAFELINTVRLAWVQIGEEIAARERAAHLLINAGLADRRPDIIQSAMRVPWDDIAAMAP